MHELYKKYRPQLFKEMVGQTEAVKVLSTFVKTGKTPHTILFTGSSGAGKTTSARILTNKLGCTETDMREINCADFRGIEMVREIRSHMGLASFGACRVYIIDEAHALSRDAQTAFLKILEDTPKHVYFFLCTTDPAKLLKTIITRCTEIRFAPVKSKDMSGLLSSIAKKEGKELTEEVIDRIVEVSEGSPRKALVVLGGVIDLESEEEQLAAVLSNDTKSKGIELARALVSPKCQWADVKGILKDLDEEPETIRYLILGYCSSILLKGGGLSKRAHQIIVTFSFNFFDSKKAGLIAACYELCS